MTKLDWHLPSDAEKQATKVLKRIDQLEERLMTKLEDIQAAQQRQGAAIGKIGSSLSNVAADVRELVEKLSTPGGISEADAAALAVSAGQIASALEAQATAAADAAALYQSAGESTPPTK